MVNEILVFVWSLGALPLWNYLGQTNTNCSLGFLEGSNYCFMYFGVQESPPKTHTYTHTHTHSLFLLIYIYIYELL